MPLRECRQNFSGTLLVIFRELIIRMHHARMYVFYSETGCP